MSYSPTILPVATAVTVGTGAFAITLPDDGVRPQLGMLLLQRSGGSDTVYWSYDPGITTSSGALISKGDPGSTTPYYLPVEMFQRYKTIYLIATAASQTVDVVVV